MATEAAEWKAKGNAALSSGNNTEAIDCYTKAITLDGSQHVFYSNRSAAYLSNDQASQALEDADACIKIKSDWAKGYARKAAALHKLQQYPEAINAYEEGLKIDPSNSTCLEGVKEINNIMASSRPTNPFGQFLGPDALDKVRSNPRIAHLASDPQFVMMLQSIQTNPATMNQYLQDPRMMTALTELMGINSEMMGKREKDASAADSPESSNVTMEETNPEPKSMDFNLTEEEKESKKKKTVAADAKAKGNALYKQKQFTQAIASYEEAIENDPTNIAYMNNIAACRLEMGDIEGCVSKCDEAIKIGRENRVDYAIMAKVYVRKGNAYAKKGGVALEQAIEAYESAQVENRTKEVEMKIKKTKKDLKKAQELAYIDPEKAVEAKAVGNTFFKEGNFPDAVKQYSEAIKRDPSNAVYYANRAAAYTKLTCFNEAKQDCDKALALDPKYVKAWSRLGAIQFFMKEYHKALESYQKGLDLEPENQDCKDGIQRTMYTIQQANQGGGHDEERTAHAMADPDIQAIMRDPVMQTVLQDLQSDPAAAQRHCAKPEIMKKLEKLIAAGILKTG